jgi:cytochrome o ubiquinol oxidase subunit 2
MTKPTYPFRHFRRLRVGAAAVGAFAASLGGCSGVLDPQGPIGRSDKIILLDSLAIMLAIVVPVILATLVFAWWFRASNKRAQYLPDWSYSGRLELMVWSIPLMVVLFLGGVGWIGAHDLDPGKPIASPVQPLNVDVVSLDWKWLFIYPDQGVASVNRLVIPAGVPVHFRLTSASVMNSFFVPQLGSQIYAMAGMTTRLNLQADKPGTFAGLSAQFSGAGFSDMQFAVSAVTPGQFTDWIAKAKAGGAMLDAGAYVQLAKPSQANPAITYGQVAPGLFDTILGLSAPGSVPVHPGPPAATQPPRRQG